MLFADAASRAEKLAAAKAAAEAAAREQAYQDALARVNGVVENGGISFSITALVILIVWIACGGFAVRQLRKADDRFNTFLPFLNVAALLAGPIFFAFWGAKKLLRKPLERWAAKRRKAAEARNAVLLDLAGDVLYAGDSKKLAAESAVAVERVRYLVTVALTRGARDLLIAPDGGEGKFTVRLKIGEELAQLPMLSAREGRECVNVFKSSAGMDTFEDQRPQEGAFMASLIGRKYRLRVTSVGAVGGEKLTIRIREVVETLNSLDDVGLAGDDLAQLKSVLASQKGMVLVCGPEGCGKRTLIKMMLKSIDCTGKNAAWIVSGGEPEIPGVSRMMVSVKEGLTPAVLLQQAMTLDTDVVAITQLSGREAAAPAAQIAAGGQLLLAGMEQRDAASALGFLLRSGAEPRLLAAGVKMIICPRVLRKLCACAQPAPLDPGYANYFAQSGLSDDKVRAPIGCRECEHTGYDGATAVFEVVTVDDELRRLLMTPGVDGEQIRSFLEARGQTGAVLGYRAMELVSYGVTSLGEVEEKVLKTE